MRAGIPSALGDDSSEVERVRMYCHTLYLTSVLCSLVVGITDRWIQDRKVS
jgi:hypothetical protein